MYRKILLPVDLDQDTSWHISLPAAIDQARHGDGTLYLLAVLPDPGASFYPSLPAQSPGDIYKEAAERLEGLAAEHIPDDITLETLISRGSIYRNIINKAREINTDLIVMTAHNPKVKDILLGSNATQVIHHAHCAVLVVRAA